MPTQRSPKRLYKYRPFDVYTLRLLSEAEVFYADPASFNDPLDGSPTIQIDTDRPTLEKLLYRMLVKVAGKEKAQSEIGRHRYDSTEYGDYKTDPDTEAYYIRRLADHVKDLLCEEFGRRGVLSLGEKWDCPLMWSHYGDKHRGLCIEYDMTNHVCPTLLPVSYRHPRSIKISSLVDWKIRKSTAARELIFDTFFLAKAPQWRYEKEWRAISYSVGATFAPANVSAVHFGLRCDNAVVTAVVKLFAETQRPMKFYVIRPRDESFALKRHRVDVDEVEATGVRSSVLLDFQDVFIDETDA